MKKTHTVFHYSCIKYENTRLKYQMATWPKRLPAQVQSIPITGDGKDTTENGILRLSIPDGYNSLAYKTQKMFRWFLDNCDTEWIIKADDDIWLSDAGIERLLLDDSRYSGCYILHYQQISLAGGPIYKIHRECLEEIVEVSSIQIDNKSAEDIHVGAAMKMIGVSPQALFSEHERCIWPQQSKTSDTMFGMCHRSNDPLNKMYDYFEGTRKACCGGGPKREVKSAPKVSKVKTENPAPTYGAKRRKFPRR